MGDGRFCRVKSASTNQESFGAPPRYPVESVDNAMELLSMFLTHDRVRVRDVAEALDVAGGTAHRLLATLQYRGYVAQDPVTKMYAPGPMLLGVGLRAAQSSDLRTLAVPHMERLNKELDETIQLATLHRTEVFFVAAVESSKALKVSSRAGTRHPAHCTSVGKAMLADLPRDRILQLYPSAKLPPVTSRSIRSRSKLIAELKATHERGYAINIGELEDGIASVACAVRHSDGRVVAAVGAGGPVSRITPERLDDVASVVAETATRIGVDLLSV
jgi:IclR family acetate operon transcriptional repressor